MKDWDEVSKDEQFNVSWLLLGFIVLKLINFDVPPSGTFTSKKTSTSSSLVYWQIANQLFFFLKRCILPPPGLERSCCPCWKLENTHISQFFYKQYTAYRTNTFHPCRYTLTSYLCRCPLCPGTHWHRPGSYQDQPQCSRHTLCCRLRRTNTQTAFY